MFRMSVAVLAATGLMLAGCEEGKPGSATKTTAEKAAGAMKDAGKAVGDATKAATEKAGEVATKTTEAVKEGAAKAGEAAQGALEAVRTEATKWLNDTVTKQWPEVKSQIAGLEQRVGALSAGELKTKAEGLLGKIKADVPNMEQLVGKIQNFKEGDLNALLAEARKLWDSFAPRLKELTGLLPAVGPAGGGGK